MKSFTFLLRITPSFSFFEFMIFATTPLKNEVNLIQLWFAFVLWIYDICHNNLTPAHMPRTVVICFRSLNLWYLPQLISKYYSDTDSCDLLSFFEFMIFATTRCCKVASITKLWFAFVLWIYDICHNSNWW